MFLLNEAPLSVFQASRLKITRSHGIPDRSHQEERMEGFKGGRGVGATPSSTSTHPTPTAPPNHANPHKQASTSVGDTTTCVTDTSSPPPTESVFIFSPRVPQPISFLLADKTKKQLQLAATENTHTHKRRNTGSEC